MKKRDKHISKIISRLVERLVEKYKPEKIILYGSYTYGTPRRGSDLDLLIIKETEDRPIGRRITVRRLVSDIREKTPFSPLVITPKELAQRLEIGDDFFLEITNRGEILYEKVENLFCRRTGFIRLRSICGGQRYCLRIMMQKVLPSISSRHWRNI